MFEKFKDAERKLVERATELEKQLGELTAQESTLRHEYDAKIAESVLAGSDSDKDKDVVALTKKIDEVTAMIRVVTDKLGAIKRSFQEALLSELPDLEKEYQQEMERRVEEYRAKTKELRDRKAEYLLFLRDFGKMRGEAKAVYTEFMQLAKIVTDKHEKLRFTMPEVNLLNNYAGAHTMNAPSEHEIRRAFNDGVLPSWVLEWEKEHKGGKKRG